MIIEIINVGTELLLGEIVNTNATYIQKMCSKLGFHVYHQSVVGDNPERFLECLKIAFSRGADCVITTGGLGPTQDDLTKELSAQFLGLEMVLNEEERKKVDEKCCFVTGLKKVTDNNFKQAYFPKDAYILENPVGTANGCIMKKDEQMIVNLPGPPKEMRYVIDHSLLPYVMQFKNERIYTYDIATIGIGESAISAEIDDLISSQDKITIACYAGEEYVRVRLATTSISLSEAMKEMKPLIDDIESRFSKYLVNVETIDEDLYQVIGCFMLDNETSLEFSSKIKVGKSDYKLRVDLSSHPLGEIVTMTMTYKNKETSYDVPLLKDASLSMNKLEAKIISKYFEFIKTL